MDDPHDAHCTTCGTDWSCRCIPGTEGAGCLFDGRQCDDCAWDTLVAQDPEPAT